MVITSLSLEHIRNHERTQLAPSPRVNVLVGGNGQGKTSILEAISLCALSKSFVPCPDAAILQRGADFFAAGLEARTDLETPYSVRVYLKPGEGKHISSSLGKRITPRELIGELPLVALSPDHRGISAGPPGERRKLMDSVLAQSSKRYTAESITLKKILRQRNALLNQGRKEPEFDYMQVEPWTDALARTGAEIALRRAAFVRTFSGYVHKACASIAGVGEDVRISYEPNALPPSLFSGEELPAIGDIRAAYYDIFHKLERDERRRGLSLAGPQKDDIAIRVNGGLARECASQGQHKTLLIGFKLAEFAYLKDVRRETPVVLLDDIFSELDAERAARVLELMRSDAQTFVTTTDRAVFERNFSKGGDHALFGVDRGRVRQLV